MGYHDVSLIQSRIDVARASRKARQIGFHLVPSLNCYGSRGVHAAAT